MTRSWVAAELEDAGAQVGVRCEWLHGVDDQLLTDRVRVARRRLDGFGLHGRGRRHRRGRGRSSRTDPPATRVELGALLGSQLVLERGEP